MREWLASQWVDIRGNVKFAIVSLLGTGVMTTAILLTRGLQLWQQAGLCICFLLMFAWAVTATATAWRTRPHSRTAAKVIPKLSPPPAVLKEARSDALDLSILDVAMRKNFGPWQGGYGVFLLIRVMNLDSVPVSISEWSFSAKFSSETVFAAHERIDSSCTIKERDNEPRPLAEISLADKAAVVTQGSPCVGWIRFETYSWHTSANNPIGGEFVLTAKDSLQRSWTARRPSCPYEEKFEISYAG